MAFSYAPADISHHNEVAKLRKLHSVIKATRQQVGSCNTAAAVAVQLWQVQRGCRHVRCVLLCCGELSAHAAAASVRNNDAKSSASASCPT